MNGYLLASAAWRHSELITWLVGDIFPVVNLFACKSAVFALDPAADHAPSPFAGDAYQWMRNAVLAAAIAKHRNIQATAVAAFADHPSFPTARKAKRGLIDASLGGQVAITPVSYQEIIDIARQFGLDQKLWADLSAWMDQKITRASSRSFESVVPAD